MTGVIVIANGPALFWAVKQSVFKYLLSSGIPYTHQGAKLAKFF
jgi:hypothetical protein